MSRHYLDVPFKEKDDAKRLGARFDWDRRRWYVEAGADLDAFSRWLPQVVARDSPAAPVNPLSPGLGTGLIDPSSAQYDLESAGPQGISLSQLLRGIAHAVERAYDGGVWTVVEIVEAHLRRHVYLDLSERNAEGLPVAKARAMIWESTAARILPEFEKNTGMTLGAGMKVLVLARPTFHVQYGFGLQIEAIDAQYSLGLLEARRREIRRRLQQEGVYQNNRRLPAPWDYERVLVIAPHQAAGLGDFRKEAERLSACGVCRFTYASSRFQGEGAAQEIVAALQSALDDFPANAPPDAVVLIRGGGAVGDLAWLDDYDLVRFLCDLTIPVLTGIGHERDRTLADEVAHLAFDTPSKVIAGIEHRILQRVREAAQAAENVFARAEALVQGARQVATRHQDQIRAHAQSHVHRARVRSQAAFAGIGRGAQRQIHQARACSRDGVVMVRTGARRQLALARQRVPGLLHRVDGQARRMLAHARHRAGLARQTLRDGVHAACRQVRHSLLVDRQRVRERARAAIVTARSGSESLAREIMGQGPKKTLARGFAIVRSDAGTPVTSRDAARTCATLEIEFNDGRIPVRPTPFKGNPDDDDVS